MGTLFGFSLFFRRKQDVQPVGNLAVFVRVQVGICLQSGLDIFVSQTLRNEQRREAKLNQERGVGMPDIVDADLLHAGSSAPALHFCIQVML